MKLYLDSVGTKIAMDGVEATLPNIIQEIMNQYADQYQDYGCGTEEGKIRRHNLELMELIRTELKILPEE